MSRMGSSLPVVNRRSHSRVKEVWNNMFDGLLAYKAEHGTFPSTTKDKVFHNCNDLGQWVVNQRLGYKNALEGQAGALSADRIAKLKKVGFDFGVLKEVGHSSDEQQSNQLPQFDLLEEAWNIMFTALVSYEEEFGMFPVPSQLGIIYNGKDLGTWVAYQRLAYKNLQDGKSGALSAYRVAKLKSVGFIFSGHRGVEQIWDYMLTGLAQFYSQHNHFRVPKDCMHGGGDLSCWLANQKQFYENNTNGSGQCLSQRRIDKMKAIGFCFEGNQGQMKSSYCNKYDEAIVDRLGQKQYRKEISSRDYDGHKNQVCKNEGSAGLSSWLLTAIAHP